MILLAVVTALILSSGCGLGEKDAEVDGTPPVVKNLMVGFDQFNAGTNQAGDFDFGHTLLGEGHTNKIFLEFGGVYRFGPEIADVSTSFAYLMSLPDGTDVVSPIDGRIATIGRIGSKDYAMQIQPTETSIWSVTITHLGGASVEAQVPITAGTKIGTANGSLALQLTLTNSETGLSYCLVPYFDDALAGEFENQIRSFMTDWETYRGDTALYDEKAMPHPGCLSVDSS